MSKTVKVTYNADTLETTIIVDGKDFDTSRINGKEIADWAYPFMVRKVRWDGFYDEMVKVLGGEKAFDLIFEGSDEALAELKEAWEDAPVNVVSGEQENTVAIAYDADALTTEIIVNGQPFDTSRINGKDIEDWVYPFMMRKVKWDGIFDELKNVLGTDEYEIQFSGSRAAMKVLLEECPETVAISYQKSQNTSAEQQNNHIPNQAQTDSFASEQKKTSDKREFVYLLSECGSLTEKEIGLKGTQCSVLIGNNIPTSRGFVINTKVCCTYFDNGNQISEDAVKEIEDCLRILEQETGKRFGNKANPLILSIQTSAPFACPGLMDCVLNIGINDEIVNSMSKNSENERWILDCYRRLIADYGDYVKYIKRDKFAEIINEFEACYHVLEENLSVNALRELVSRFKSVFRNETGQDFPQDIREQLFGLIKEALESWDAPRSNWYRRVNDLPFNAGLAVVVQEMIQGNKNVRSGTGVLYSRHPATGANQIVGEFLSNAQGIDLVAGKRQPMDLNQFQQQFPSAFGQLEDIYKSLEKHYRDMIDMEFSIEDDRLFILNHRIGRRTDVAADQISMNLAAEGLITQQEAEQRIQLHLVDCLEDGIVSYDREEYEKAIQKFQYAADHGVVDAKVELGICYILGNGTEKDSDYGYQLIKEAADEGSDYAQRILETEDEESSIDEEFSTEDLKKSLKTGIKIGSTIVKIAGTISGNPELGIAATAVEKFGSSAVDGDLSSAWASAKEGVTKLFADEEKDENE